MKRYSDYHTHTILCKHAKGEISEYVSEAVNKGLEEIGFADHAPDPFGYDPEHRMAVEEMPDYIGRVEQMRKDFPEITIRLGLELDCYPGFESYIDEVKAKYPIEYTIGSVHFVQGMSIFHTDPLKLSYEDAKMAIQGYFDLVSDAARSHIVDIVGHLDVLKLIFPHNRDIIYEKGWETLKVIADEGKVLEMNLSGFRKPINESYPDIDLLKVAAEYKIPVCLGADAHRPEQVGLHFDRAIPLLKQAGLTRQKKAGPGLNVFIV
jgi:histidinol-phosphatase (PHP family)